ncbi:diguanylate cyclase [Pokkaliibacter sp. MBI-7]|uniref:sensor domain-containing diguanylate cyclase n=1 Tax=Pokkaliibacter sp. MBI-7 TaxID=3040600 RepID=UPI002448D056|nr:diguanylate cyclase [Pokkaliibacter sp. MBI-7]MDH2431779.1 diguanylate cyclase [Pokkaliibacter sp. MBI-7]
MDIKTNEQLQKVLIEHIGTSENGIAVLDAKDQVIFYNQAFLRAFGLQDYPVYKQSYDDLLSWMFTTGVGMKAHTQKLDEWLAYIHSQYRSAPFRNYEVELVDGRWLLMTEQLSPDGEVVLVCNDVTLFKQVELALQKAQIELARQAMTDELTSLPNRRHFMQQLDNECQRAHRYGHTTSLAVIDIDHFKKINDGYGHPTGDEVLRHFAGLLAQRLRKNDVVGRLGGEEFALLLPETSKESARAVVSRLQQRLASENLEHISPGFRYTFSAGVAECEPSPQFCCADWMRAADETLYRAKAAGRNCVMVYDGSC